MHLYLKINRLTREIPGITLRDGCIPVIGNQFPSLNTNPADDEKPVYIEPAVWFKVLILDSITIDCLKRGIKWTSRDMPRRIITNNKSSDGIVNRRCLKRQLSKTIYSEEEYYNYQSNMDVMFEKAIEVMTAYGDMKINTYEFNETLLQLLHCYVLPAIRLSADDIPLTEAAYGSIEALIDEKNNEIDQKNSDIQRQKDALAKLRKTFIEELQSSAQPKLYPSELQTCLVKDLKIDITSAWHALEASQMLVEQAKCKKCLVKVPSIPDRDMSTTVHDTSNNDVDALDGNCSDIELETLHLTSDTLKRMSHLVEAADSEESENADKTFPKPRGKSPGCSDSCTECCYDLDEKRQLRNQNHEHYLRLINARENLINFMNAPKKKKVPTATLR